MLRRLALVIISGCHWSYSTSDFGGRTDDLRSLGEGDCRVKLNGHERPSNESGHDHRWIVFQDQRWGMSRPVGGLRKYGGLFLWAVGVVAGSSVGATPPSEKLLRDSDSPIDLLGHAHVAGW